MHEKVDFLMYAPSCSLLLFFKLWVELGRFTSEMYDADTDTWTTIDSRFTYERGVAAAAVLPF
jgi:hypothetical protein